MAWWLLTLVPFWAGCQSSSHCQDLALGSLCLAVEIASPMRLGFAPRALAFADVDADGVGDLVATSDAQGTLTVIWGGGEDFDGKATAWSIDSQVADVVVADLDNDGHYDIATALPDSDAVALIRGLGHRSFAEPEYHAAGSDPRALLAADLDGMSPPELVTANLDGGTISVLRDLVVGPPLVVGPGPRGLAAGDFDGDRNNDLAVTIADIGAIQILVGDGAGGLMLGSRHIIGSAPYGVVTADFDGNGAPDIAASNSLGDSVSVLWGEKKGTPRSHSTWPTVPEPEDLVVVARPDSLPLLGVLSRATSTVEILDPLDGTAFGGATKDPASAIAADNLGSVLYASNITGQIGSMAPGTGLRFDPMWTGPQADSIWPIDLEDDGINELLLVEPGNSSGHLIMWRGGPTTASSVSTGLTTSIIGAQSGKLTDNTLSDVVVWSSEALVVLVQQTGNSMLQALNQPSAFSDQIQDVVIGDADGDGLQEVMTLSGKVAEETRLQTFSVDSSGALNLETDIPLGISVNALDAVHGGGDERIDLIMQDDQGTLQYLQDATLPLRMVELGNSPRPQGLALYDVDYDGTLDAIYCAEDGIFHVRDFLGGAVSDLISRALCDRISPYDLDDDGAVDLLSQTIDRRQTPNLVIIRPWLRGLTGWASGGAQSILVPIIARPQFARLDANNVPDILLAGTSVPDTRAIQNSLGAALVEKTGPRLDNALRFRFGDLNGDGAHDLIGFSENLAVAIADRKGSFSQLSSLDRTLAFGSSGAFVQDLVTGDFNDDGVDEIIAAIGSSPPTTITLVRQLGAPGANSSPEKIAVISMKQANLFSMDISGDSITDLLLISVSSGLDTLVFEGTGQGRFSAPRRSTLFSPSPVTRPILYDMNSDGQLDILALSKGGVVMFPGRDGTSFESGQYWTTLTGQAYLPGDFDEDGAVDVAILANGTLRIAPGNSPGSNTDAALQDVTAIARLDTRDGRHALIASGNLPHPLVAKSILYRGSTVGRNLEFAAVEVPMRSANALNINDFDGDGLDDVLSISPEGVTVLRQQP